MCIINKSLSLSILALFLVVTSFTQTVIPNNNKCLKCHGNDYYKFYNRVIDKEVHHRMNPYFIINKTLYKKGVHKSFQCTDCHATEYEIYPHKAELKLEAKNTCLDCHGSDETFAKFHFEEIEVEVKKSIHGKLMGEDFNCERCHKQHYYELNARNKTDINKIVDYSNHMCLNCHNYTENKFYLLSDSTASIDEKSHSWLPNRELHFKKVRCLECHAQQNDSLKVPHRILGKEKAVKLCVKCHSDNSLLMSSLYKHDIKENRNKFGFFNGVLLKNSFVIGANRNFYLNSISISIFSLVLLIIFIHAFIRIILKK
ncbi:MAG: hypothetical protein AUJ98_02350 [Bacteroidetes bacterium CG2_30_33_31]|nr:MAG: hypothetical protein AUJ98_02350 [Bacteroidetes bacterium CG2_30_33_31]